MVTGYGFDAQTVFDTEVPKGALLIEIFRADNTAYPKKLKKAREMLSRGEAPPPEFSRPEFSRPEVAKILMAYYQSTLA